MRPSAWWSGSIADRVEGRGLPMLLIIIVSLLAAVGIAFTTFLVRAALAAGQLKLRLEPTLVGTVANFFDTLGHRLVRADHWPGSVPAHGPGPADPADHAGRLHPAGARPGIIFLILLGVSVDPLLLFGLRDRDHRGGWSARRSPRGARVWIGPARSSRSPCSSRRCFYALSNLGSDARRRHAAGLPLALTIIAIAGQLRLRRPAQFRGRQLCPDPGDARA